VDGHHNRVFAGVCHPTDPNIFLTGGWDSTVQFWDIRVNSSVRSVHVLNGCYTGRAVRAILLGKGKGNVDLYSAAAYT